MRFIKALILLLFLSCPAQAWTHGAITYPVLPGLGTPCGNNFSSLGVNCDLVVGYTSSSPTQVVLNPDTSCSVCPANVTKSAAEAFYRVNAGFTNWSFAGVGYPLHVQNPNVVISQVRLDLTNWGSTNVPVVRTTVAGAYYSLVNVTADGGTGANVTALCSGAALLIDRVLVNRWPNDWCDPTKIDLRTDSKSLVAGLCQTGMSGGLPTGVSFGITVVSRPHFNFFCTTGSSCVTASSEPAAYSTAIDGEVVTDGTCSFTTSATTNKVRYANVQISSTVLGLHGDGTQITGISAAGQMSAGADWEWHNIVIDGSVVVGPGTYNNGVNWCSGFGSPNECVWSVNATFRDSILFGPAGSYSMSWGCNTQCVVTGSATYTNIYLNSVGAGALHPSQPIAPNLTMNNIKNYYTGAIQSFQWNNNGVTTVVTSIP